MIILHAGAYDDSLAVWAETSDVQYADIESSKDLAGTRYVFSASPQQLASVLDAMGTKSRDVSQSYILLPTRADDTPIPSSGMIAGDNDGDDAVAEGLSQNDTSGSAPSKQLMSMSSGRKKTARGRPRLAEWWVNTALLNGQDVILLLCSAMGKRVLSPGVVVGDDLAYLADVMRLAGSLVARQQYMPDMVREYSKYVAVWRPVITGTDSEKFDALASQMPGSVWSFPSEEDGEKIPSGKPAHILERILGRMLNDIIRLSVSGNGQIQGGRRKLSFDSVHDEWVYKLKTPAPEAILAADAPDMHKEVINWQRPLRSASDVPIRLCFRLEEPDTAGGHWFVRYMLQSRTDPSLLVPADEELDSESSILPKGANVKEFLLTSLGHASGLFSGISDGLKNGSGPDTNSYVAGCQLDTDIAHDFLTRDAPALEQAGYGVIFPSWWTGRGTKAKIKARADVKTTLQSKGMLDLGTIVEFDWQIAIGDRSVTLDELQRLADAKAPLVRMRGEWVEVSSDDIKQALSYLKKRSKKRSLFDVIKMKFWDPELEDRDAGSDDMQGDSAATSGIDIEIASSDGRITQILDQLDGKAQLEDIKQPAKFEGTLRHYQKRGFSWMWFLKKFGLGGCLADDMGLGKTIQVLALIQHHISQHARNSKKEGNERRPFLLICPTSVISNWQREASRFVPELSVHIHHGADRSKSAPQLKKNAAAHDVVVSSYGLLQRDLEKFKGVKWEGVILDEAQNIKNYNTKQARAARAINAMCRFALTGTPVENNIGDMWSIMEFLNPGFLGNQAEFRRNFFVPIQTMQDPVASKRLKTATGPFILRRLKTDKKVISDLPDKIEAKMYCSLTKEQASLYEAVLHDIEQALLEADSGMKRRGLILSSLARLKQVCDHPALFLKDNSGATGSGVARSGKLARLTDMMSEVLDAGDKALVFTQFVEMGHILRRHLQEMFGQEVMFLHGGTSRGDRDEMVRRFQDDTAGSTGPPILVISVKAGGTGLNLTAASHVFHYDRWWNPAVEDQATDRAYRIGQKRNVQVHKMVCSGTLEEKIDAMIEHKKDISRSVVGTGEGWITEMSNEDLRDVLALSTEATSNIMMTEEDRE